MKDLKTTLSTSVYELKTFDWSSIRDPASVGMWPAPVKFLIATLIFVICLVAGYWFDIKALQENLQRVATEEVGLRTEFETKAVLASNLEAYRARMAESSRAY